MVGDVERQMEDAGLEYEQDTSSHKIMLNSPPF